MRNNILLDRNKNFMINFMEVHMVMVSNVSIALVVVGSFIKAHVQCFLTRFELYIRISFDACTVLST